MSYCRWSTDDFACDLYIYEDTGGGWTIHIARARLTEPAPPVSWPGEDWDGTDTEATDEFVRTHNAQMEHVATAEREVITLPHAGETLHLATAGDCADECERLRALGYRFPDYVITALRAEHALTLAGGPQTGT